MSKKKVSVCCTNMTCASPGGGARSCSMWRRLGSVIVLSWCDENFLCLCRTAASPPPVSDAAIIPLLRMPSLTCCRRLFRTLVFRTTLFLLHRQQLTPTLPPSRSRYQSFGGFHSAQCGIEVCGKGIPTTSIYRFPLIKCRQVWITLSRPQRVTNCSRRNKLIWKYKTNST